MSIKPIDYQTSLVNSINEAKSKHIDYHKVKDNSQLLEIDLKNQVKRDQKKVINTEKSTSKKVDGKKEEENKKQNKDKKNKRDKDKYKKIKGQSLDIFI